MQVNCMWCYNALTSWKYPELYQSCRNIWWVGVNTEKTLKTWILRQGLIVGAKRIFGYFCGNIWHDSIYSITCLLGVTDERHYCFTMENAVNNRMSVIIGTSVVWLELSVVTGKQLAEISPTFSAWGKRRISSRSAQRYYLPYYTGAEGPAGCHC